ncbi:FAD-dependent monooxygenase [Micromonospora arborensis]|uniref:FAD-dependent monooxygenase n=1 Tax=Micromonospora arborensis TaxID=2116518 RepID=UPI003F4CC3AE
MKHTDVIIVGAGPTGLLLAAELRLAGVRPLVLERQPRRRDTPKAGGLGGQILELLRYRGLLDRFEAACTGPVPPPRFPFGGVHLDFTRLADPPLHALPLPQQQLEGLLAEHAGELGADIRRGHQVIGLSQAPGRRPADPSGRAHRLGWGWRARAVRSALQLVRHPETLKRRSAGLDQEAAGVVSRRADGQSNGPLSPAQGDRLCAAPSGLGTPSRPADSRSSHSATSSSRDATCR